jgi:hypothetical protein
MSKTSDKATLWRQHIEGWRNSGLTQQAYCRENQLSYPSFGYWLKRFRARANAVSDVSLVPVCISTSSMNTPSNIFLQLAICRIEIAVYTDIAYVRSLVEALS